MLEVSLSGFGKARVWSRECPVDPVKPYNGIALEVSIPRGGMCAYGLLGASAGLHHSGPGCEVVAPASGRRWHGSLVERIDEVRVGLPAELVATVQRAGAAEAERTGLETTILYDCAAHGLVGSNEWVFGRLAIALVRVTADRSLLEDELRLRGLLEELEAR